MARIRSVHPGLFTDEAFVSRSPLARLLFIGLWTEADDEGAFEWKPIQIKMRLLPVDNTDVAPLLAELVEANMMRRYSAGGREYGAIRNFRRFQRPKKPKSVHPMPAEVRTYVGCGDVSSVSDDPESPGSSEQQDTEPQYGSKPQEVETDRVPKKGELRRVQASAVPKKSRKSPQMEEGGGRMEYYPSRTADPGSLGEPQSRGGGHATPGDLDPGWDEDHPFGDEVAA